MIGPGSSNGVDDLSRRCHTMIINLLPMTRRVQAAEGALYESGDEKVRIIFPTMYVRKEGSDSQYYSEDERLEPYSTKRTISDAVTENFPRAQRRLPSLALEKHGKT